MRKKTVSVIVLSLLTMLALTFSINPVSPSPDVVIGWSIPITGPVSGTAAVHHLYYRMIIDYYNDNFGGLNVGGGGVSPISVIEIDDGYDTATMLQNYQDIIDAGADLLFAPWSTAHCVAALPLFEANQYPVVGLTVGSNTLQDLLQSLTYTYFFVTLGQPREDADQLVEMFAYINAEIAAPDQKITRVGMAYRADEHGIEHAEAIKAGLEGMGLVVPVYQSYAPIPPPTEDAWDAIIGQFDDADCDTVIVCSYDEGAVFVDECIALDFNPRMLMVGPAMETPFLVYGVFGFTPGEACGISYYNGFPATTFNTPELQDFVADHLAYTATHGLGFPYLPFPASAVFYSGLECLFQAVETPGVGLNRPAIRDTLNTTTFDTKYCGEFTFRLGLSPSVESHGTLSQWQGGDMMEVVWPLVPDLWVNKLVAHVIYPKFPWAWAAYDPPTWAQVPDLNRDGIVYVQDITAAAKSFGAYPGHARWKYLPDWNRDGIVDIKDVTAIARAFGKHVV